MKRTDNPKAKQTFGPTEANAVSLLHGWHNLLEDPHPYKERVAEGKQMRNACPRSSHGVWKPAEGRVDPLSLLASQEQSRLENLIPLRYGRMMRSPFAFYRGGALLMASDLASLPRTQAYVQLCGDCHLSNFGI